MYSLPEQGIRAIPIRLDRMTELSRAIREFQFTRMIDELERRELIKNVEHVGENAYGCTLHYASWPALAKKAAGVTTLPGIVQPTRSGLVWICGGGGPHGALIDNTLTDPDRPDKGSRLDAVIRARTAMAKTGYTGNVPWTVGGIAKKLLLYVGPKDDYNPSCERLFSDGSFHIDQGYHICKPGSYDHAELFDVSSYYGTIFSRIVDNPRQSFRVILTRSGVNFQKWNDGERERFRQVIDACSPEKGLRNALVGSGQGSLGQRYAYTSSGAEPGRARRFTLYGKPGPIRPFSLLVVRSAYELAQKEALTSGAIYGMIDSVMLTLGSPSVWPAYGLAVETKANGPAEVYSRGNYRVGPEKKKLYLWGVRDTEEAPGNTVIPFQYHRAWL